MQFANLHAWLISTLRRFARSDRGNVAMMFALFMVPLLAASGLAVDVARAYRIRTVTQGAVDAAALAAGRAAQTNPSSPLTSATNAANTYFNIAKPTSVLSSSLGIASGSNNTSFTLTSTTWISTPFLSALSRLDSTGAETCPSSNALGQASAGRNGGSGSIFRLV